MEPLEKMRTRLVVGAPRVLVAVPCYNEEDTIAEVVRQAREFADEVLVINDGSKDRTAEVAEAAGATVSHNPGNKGKGYGVRRAFEYAYEGDFDALVLMDGDLQHDPAEIPALLAPVLRKEDPADVGLGFRFGELTEMPLWRKAGKRVLDYATAIMGAGIVTDSQCGYRAFGKRAIVEMQQLSGEGFVIESEQLVIARRSKLRLENVRIVCRYEGLDGSTQHPVRHAAGVLWGLTKLSFGRQRVLRHTTLAAMLLIAGVSLIILL